MSMDFMSAGRWLRKRTVLIGICLLLTGVGFYILFNNGNRFTGIGRYLFLLACPLMHLFMHQGHGGHGNHGLDTDDGIPTGLRRTQRDESGDQAIRHPR